MTALAEQIPEDDRASFACKMVDLELLGARCDLGIVPAGLTHAREIAFHIRHKDRHAARTEASRQRLQRYRSGGAGDEAVPVRHVRQQIERFVARLRDEDWLRHETARASGCSAGITSTSAGVISTISYVPEPSSSFNVTTSPTLRPSSACPIAV